ncbi:trypsin-like serine protease [Nocardioides astragali]|uniref:Trypsin-like serine protease n=1 Tax=Nocardioides astragali TaxID=1776736 RepID=A0ABW2N9S9_9ACTN|nr:trypsin-like serine protease [Nocardioides astragali]
MRKMLVLLTGLLMATTVTAPPAAAITGNYVEDVEHSFVGLVVFYDEEGEFVQRCSGSLLTSTVFLTAGHCTDAATGAVTARVYFQQDAGAHYDPATGMDPVSGYPETCAAGTLGTLCATSDELYNYGFPGGLPDSGDAGLVILDQDIAMPEYGALAAAGTLDRLATRRGQQALTFTASGYGLTEVNPVKVTSFRERLMAQAQLTNLRSHLTDGFNLQTNGNGAGRGGTCSGDSGGPVFYGGFESNLIVAVTSFGLNEYCRGTDFAFRTDQQAVLDWIRDSVGESTWADITLVTI